MSVTLTYLIPKNVATPVATQITTYRNLVLDQGELAFLLLRITSNTVTDLGPGNPAAKLRRVIVLDELVPDFADTFGASQHASQWGLKTLWQGRIATALATDCEAT